MDNFTQESKEKLKEFIDKSYVLVQTENSLKAELNSVKGDISDLVTVMVKNNGFDKSYLSTIITHLRDSEKVEKMRETIDIIDSVSKIINK